MVKNRIMNTMTTVVMVLAFSACGSDDFFGEEEAFDRAKEILGVEIPSTQDWNMTSTTKASIVINQNYGETYNIKIYSEDPMFSDAVTILAEGMAEDGKAFETTFDCATADKSLFVGITNSHGRTFYRSAPVNANRLIMSIGTPYAQVASSRGMRRSATAPSVPHITIPDAAYAASFLEGAKEPTAENVVDNHDGSHYEGGQQVWVVDVPGHNEEQKETKWVDGTAWGWGWAGTGGTLNWNYANAASMGVSAEDIAFWDTYCTPYNNGNWAFYGADNQNDAATKLIVEYLRGTGRGSWVNVWSEGSTGGYQEVVTGSTWVPEQGHYETSEQTFVEDETYVKKFKITGEYNKLINVLSTEQQYGDARTVYISGKWTLSDLGTNNGQAVVEQRVGGGAVIVIDNGGELVIPEGKLMTFVNQARLVVMPGGKISGGGKIEVTNGNAEGLEGYNGGTIDIATFNNNFGKFYNYGTFKCTNLQGGAGESNFYNHGVAHIVQSGVAESWGGNYNTPNTRIFNACQFYCERDMRAYIIEMTGGSYFKVDGELMMSDGTDGTSVNSYVALDAGALMEVGTLWNNNCSWIGPTSGYAVAQIGGLSYMNWTGNEPITSGYFINNIAVSIDDPTIGTGNGQGVDTYVALRDFILNGYGSTGNVFDPIGKVAAPEGNGGAVLVEKGTADMTVSASDDFVLGEAGCTPGYNPTASSRKKVKPAVWSYAFEDSRMADYDMNDVVIKVSYGQIDDYTLDTSHLMVTLCCTGASYDLTAHLNNTQLFGRQEVHAALGGTASMFINTGSTDASKNQECDYVTVTIDTPSDFQFADADFWINTPEGKVEIAKTGQDPHGVVIPADWKWPKEKICIKEAYPNFIYFARDPSNEEYAGWYKTWDSSKVYTKGN